jgi:hypothetical protein
VLIILRCATAEVVVGPMAVSYDPTKSFLQWCGSIYGPSRHLTVVGACACQTSSDGRLTVLGVAHKQLHCMGHHNPLLLCPCGTRCSCDNPQSKPCNSHHWQTTNNTYTPHVSKGVFGRNPRFYSNAASASHLLDAFPLATVCVAPTHPYKYGDMHTPTSQALLGHWNTATPTYEGLRFK